MILVTVGLIISIEVDPVVCDMALAIDAVLVARVKITLVARPPAVAGLLADRALRRVISFLARRTVVLSLLLVDVEERVGWAQLTLVCAFLAMAQVASVALSQMVGAPSTDCN